MTEFLLNAKILHSAAQNPSGQGAVKQGAAGQTAAAQTGDCTWILILLLVAIIALIIYFKKKSVRVLLSLILVFGLFGVAPKKSFAVETVSITSSAEVSEDQPAELTITNNDDYAISINNFEIVNQALPEDTTWDISIVKDNYEIKEAGKSGNICFEVNPHSSFKLSVYPNVEDIPDGELCNFKFSAVSNHYKTTYINNENNVKTPNEFDFSFQELVSADASQLNRDIAISEATFACIPNTYNNLILDGKDYKVEDRIAFMRNLGFVDNMYCKLWPDKHLDMQADEGVSVTMPDYTKDANDVTSFSFNHRKINFGSHETEIINISVGATGGDFEWASNFDFGAETEDYQKATGDHPEWTEKCDHKGFDIAKNRLLTVYNSYSSKYIDNSANVDKVILVNGHSRGGGIANLLGKHFENMSLNKNVNGNIKTLVYTFAAPNTTAVSLDGANADNTIFNILNMDDLVCQFPGYISGFYKYGKDVKLSVHDDKDLSGTPMSQIFQDKSGYGEYNGNDPKDVDSLIDATCDLIGNRNDAYTLDSASSKEYTKLGSYETEAEAKQGKIEFQKHLEKHNLQYFAEITEIEHRILNNDYVIKFKCCAAFIMQDISNFVFIYKGDTNKYQPAIGYNMDLINILLEAIGVIPGVLHGHIWMSYNMLATYDKY